MEGHTSLHNNTTKLPIFEPIKQDFAWHLSLEYLNMPRVSRDYFWRKQLANKELQDFLQHQAKARGLSLRALSINAGLSASTVHNIVKRQYEPSLFSLNRLADYLHVKRQYLWQIAGFLTDMDYNEKSIFGDPRLRFLFAEVDKLPEPTKDLIISVVEAIRDRHRSWTPWETAPEE